MKTLLLLLAFGSYIIIAEQWQTNFDTAQEMAKTQQKNTLIVFSGSDWCKPCIQLHKELFETNVFKDFAKEHLVMLKADFPYRKKNKLPKEQTIHNEALAERYNPNGEFPLAILIDHAGNVIGSFGYDKHLKPVGYLTIIKSQLK